MTWTWGDPIDADTDLQDVGLNAAVRAAVHERILASGLNLSLGASPPSFATGDPANRAANANGTGPIGSFAWAYNTLTECQQALQSICHVFVDRATYPSALAGVAATTVPGNFRFTTSTLAQALGYPPDSGGAYRLWRRRMPRRVYGYGGAKPGYWPYGYLLSGTQYFQHVSLNDASPDDLAQSYTGGALVGSGPPSLPYLADRDVPGQYRGIVQLQGGVWQPAPPGSVAGILDSNHDNSDPYAPNPAWCPAGLFTPGDYWGWWLFRDLVEACKRLTWTCPLVAHTYSTLDAAGQGKWLSKFGQVTNAASAGAAQSGANAAMAAATPAVGNELTGLPIVEGIWGAVSGYQYSASARSARCYLGAADQYQGLARDTDAYAAAVTSGDVFDNAGTAVVQNQFAALGSTAAAAGAHAWAIDGSPLVLDYPNAPFGIANKYYGFILRSPTVVQKWHFTYA